MNRWRLSTGQFRPRRQPVQCGLWTADSVVQRVPPELRSHCDRDHASDRSRVSGSGFPPACEVAARSLRSARSASPIKVCESVPYEKADLDQPMFVQPSGDNRHQHICALIEVFPARMMPSSRSATRCAKPKVAPARARYRGRIGTQTAPCATRRCRDPACRSLRSQGAVAASQFRPRRRDPDPDPRPSRRPRSHDRKLNRTDGCVRCQKCNPSATTDRGGRLFK